jgi:hypothetical protein
VAIGDAKYSCRAGKNKCNWKCPGDLRPVHHWDRMLAGGRGMDVRFFCIILMLQYVIQSPNADLKGKVVPMPT